MAKVIRAKYEGGVLKPLDPLDLEEGEEVVIVLKDDIVEFARRVRKHVQALVEPSELLSRERERFDW